MSDSQPANHKEIIQLIKRISGQANFIGTPRIFVELFDGDIVTAVWFNQVVYWDGKTAEPIGFYKTAEEWKSEIGLSKFQSRRAARISQERGLVQVTFKKVYGTPKNHYLVIWPELLRLLQELLNKSDLAGSELSQTAMSKVKDLDLPQSERSEVQDSVTSLELAGSETSLINQEIQSENQIEEEEEIILPEIDITPRALLDHLGLVFDAKTFGRLAIRKEYLQKSGPFVLGWVAKAYLDGKRLRDPIAFIASRIAGDKLPDLYYLESFREILPEEYLEAVGLASYACPDCSQVFAKRAELSSHWLESHDREDETEETASPPACTDPEAGRAWDFVINQLKMEMPRASFESWVKTSRAVIIEDGTLRVWTPTAYAREWLESRLASTVSRLLVGVLGRSVAVEFFTGSGNV